MTHEEQLKRLQEDFPEAEAISQPGGWWLEVRGVALPPGWAPPATRLAFEVSETFPEAKPEGFWVEPGLQAPPPFPPAPGGGEERHGALWAKVCYQVQVWDKHRETYWRYLKAMSRYFAEPK